MGRGGPDPGGCGESHSCQRARRSPRRPSGILESAWYWRLSPPRKKARSPPLQCCTACPKSAGAKGCQQCAGHKEARLLQVPDTRARAATAAAAARGAACDRKAGGRASLPGAGKKQPGAGPRALGQVPGAVRCRAFTQTGSAEGRAEDRHGASLSSRRRKTGRSSGACCSGQASSFSKADTRLVVSGSPPRRRAVLIVIGWHPMQIRLVSCRVSVQNELRNKGWAREAAAHSCLEFQGCRHRRSQKMGRRAPPRM